MSRFLRAAAAVARKDILVELRGREIVLSMSFFAGLVLILCAFALIKEGQAPEGAAGGVLWITLALAGTLGLGRAFDREREHETFSALLLAPAPRAAIYVGKLAGIAVFMIVAEAAAVPLTALLFNAPLFAHLGWLAALLLLGTLGYAAVGALFAAMLARSRGRHVLLGLLLYPVVVPVLIAGARGTQALLALPTADPSTVGELWQQIALWAKILLLFDVAFLTLALWVFEPLVASGE